MSESIVYNMDCMEYMKTLPDKAFDLAIVDPPYGDGNSEIGGGEKIRREVRPVQDATVSTTLQNREQGDTLGKRIKRKACRVFR